MSSLLLSVVIPTYERLETLTACLDCLAPDVQTLSSDHYEVIVTDDGRKITAEEVIREQYPWAHWVEAPRKGVAANRNNGASHATGEWIVFTDDDCLPDANWLEAYAGTIQSMAEAGQSTYQVLEGRIYAPRPRQTFAEVSPVNETGGFLWSCNFAIQRSLFEDMGGFDIRFPLAGFEDVDFRTRLVKRNVDTLFLYEASLCHPWRRVDNRPWNEGAWDAHQQEKQGLLIYLAIHPEERERLSARSFVWRGVRAFAKEFMQGLVTFRGAGWEYQMLRVLGSFDTAFYLFTRGDSAYPNLDT